MNILISIGNSDDKLTQRDWSEFIASVRELLDWPDRVAIHGEWFSAPDKPWQNANWCIETRDDGARFLIRRELRKLAERYRQDSIAWTQGEVEFLGAEGTAA